MSPDICFILLSFYRPVSDAQRSRFAAPRAQRSELEASVNNALLESAFTDRPQLKGWRGWAARSS
jgi:hypothetical protein